MRSFADLKSRLQRSASVGLAVSIFFALKLVLGIGILIVAGRLLSVTDFAIFSQFLVLLALLVTLATAGTQHGIIREISAGHNSRDATHSIIRASLTIWGAVSIFLVFICVLSAPTISILLVGSRQGSSIIPWLGIAAVGTGFGLLLCAILTGQGRPVASLTAQGVGLLVASCLTVFFLLDRNAAAAALSFAFGPLLMTILAAGFLGRTIFDSLRFGTNLAKWVRSLFGFSLAFLATAAIMPSTLIALRSVYLETFGLELLGFWLAANRISDVNTQLLGLYLTQEFLPKASASNRKTRRQLLIKTFTIGSVAMLLALCTFAAAPNFWVETILSAKFLPATAFIVGYFAGDVLRVSAALFAYTALARKRLLHYISIEAAAALLMTILVLGLTSAKIALAPALAYPITYGAMSLTIILWWWFADPRGGRAHRRARGSGS